MTLTGAICLAMVALSCLYMAWPATYAPPPIQEPPRTDLPAWDMPDWGLPPADWEPGAMPEWMTRPPAGHVPMSHGERRRMRVKQNGGAHTRAEWLALCEQYGNRCLRCGKKRPLSKDHVIPVLLGGSNDISNIQPLCRSCNSSKGASIVDYRRG